MRTAVCALVLAALLLGGCAPGPNQLVNTPNSDGVVAGFWRGLWNGMISPITFVISLFSSSVQVYEVHNSGGWYNFGFILGAAVALGSGGGAGGAAARRRRG
jgi:TctA family transporter